MKAKNQHGFTIIEVSLFLGISTLLMVGLMSGITASINRQRFTDSMQSTQAFLQQQFSETINVVNNRSSSQLGSNCGATGSSTLGASSCIVIGKALYFAPDDDKITSYPVISQDPSLDNLEDSTNEWESLSSLHPVIKDNINKQTYNVPWAAETTSITRVEDISISHSDASLDNGEVTGGVKGDDINFIILLRSPYSGRTFIYGYKADAGDIGEGSDKLANETKKNEDLSTTNMSDFLICIHSQDISKAYGGVYFTGTGSQDSVVTRFKFPHDKCVNQET